MTPLAMVLALSWLNILWHFFGVIVVLLCVFLTAIILMQDSKGAGLTSAFGAGPGGESLLGARMQKDVARWTAIVAGIFGVLVLVMGLMGTYISRYVTAGEAGMKKVSTEATEKSEPGMGMTPEAPPTPPASGASGSPPPAGGATVPPVVPPAPGAPPSGTASPAPTPAPAAPAPATKATEPSSSAAPPSPTPPAGSPPPPPPVPPSGETK